MITSHEEFALESYEYNVTDFLKKLEWPRFQDHWKNKKSIFWFWRSIS